MAVVDENEERHRRAKRLAFRWALLTIRAHSGKYTSAGRQLPGRTASSDDTGMGYYTLHPILGTVHLIEMHDARRVDEGPGVADTRGSHASRDLLFEPSCARVLLASATSG